MAEINATILIPDISGFTEFMTKTELSHSSHAISMLIDAIVNAVGEDYEVSEIEGDAVLLVKKGAPPTKKDILDICIKIFNAFHYQRKWMMQHTLCPCKACMDLVNLTLKFVVHYGPLAEIKVGRFVKYSGLEMIVAHRLLKNRIENHEYLLVTEKMMQRVGDEPDTFGIEWEISSENFDSIGSVAYYFALLNEARKHTPEPPEPPRYKTDDTPYLEETIAGNFKDVYTEIMNIPDRDKWVPGLLKVEQEIPDVFVGNMHHCTFETYRTKVTPLHMEVSADSIVYAEKWEIEGTDYELVYEFVFKDMDDQRCQVFGRFMNAGHTPLTQPMSFALFENLQSMFDSLKKRFGEITDVDKESFSHPYKSKYLHN